MERQSQLDKTPQQEVAELAPVVGRMQLHREAVLDERAKVGKVREVLSGELQGEELDRATAQVRRNMHVESGVGPIPSRNPILVKHAVEEQVIADYLGRYKKPDIS